MKTYTEKLFRPGCLITIKLDGVKGICKDGVWTSRANKELYNLPKVANGEYEIYLGDFKSSISACRTRESERISINNLYRLDYPPDSQLHRGIAQTHEQIIEQFNEIVALGGEGVVVWIDDIPYKLKKDLTLDVVVMGIIEGTGKNINKLGAFVVRYKDRDFKVGTGFTDSLRKELFSFDLIGKIVEIKGMEITEYGAVRHPVFIRVREDLL